jgi:murein DD-endopeptidase MepM/ murein hydrolase activator NlpD
MAYQKEKVGMLKSLKDEGSTDRHPRIIRLFQRVIFHTIPTLALERSATMLLIAKALKTLMTSPWMIALMIILTMICPQLWANVTYSQLCTAMVGKSYTMTQGYLVYNKDNPTPDDLHAGIDYAVPQGILVRTIVGGTLVNVDPSIGSIGIDDGKGVTFYLHMSGLKLKNTDIGKFYQFGTPIGYVSSIGVPSKKVHLHVEVRERNKTYPNPTQPVGGGTLGSTASNTYDPLSYF